MKKLKGYRVSGGKQGNEAKAGAVPPPAFLVFADKRHSATACKLLAERYPDKHFVVNHVKGKFGPQFCLPESLTIVDK